jgi:asparagine synthase (glutamine-hydrolysing)
VCGIVGKFGFPDFDVADGLRRIIHRGPDGHAVEEHDGMTHGHCRLSLLDLSTASAQPFHYRGGVLSFNGEVWNFRELRAELAGLGHAFTTTGDTEVLAAALDEWGTDALQRLDGMFAFAWSRGQTRILVRDRYGKTPLYALRRGRGFAWASERKAFGARSGAAAPVPPGSLIDLDAGTVRRWYAVPDRADHGPGDLLGLLDGGVRRRLVADAPLCVLVSGGLDSAAILTLAKRHKPDVVGYTAALDLASPDLLAARRLCAELGVELREVRVDAPDHAAIRAAVSAIEIPSKAQIEIALLCLPLARRIAADGFKACLSGEAADELFGGYGNMMIQGSSCDDAGWRQLRLDQLAKMARGNFVRCNKAFLSAGVECRLPFMNRSLVECVLSLSKRDCPPGKGLLKRALAGVVPPWVVARQKQTFQGASGMANACARIVAEPVRFYNAETRSLFGALTEA